MNVVFCRCCGIDVHKDRLTACVPIREADGRRVVRKKEFETHLKGLENLRLWLYANKVTQVAMESTGVYWKPVWNVLSGHFGLLLANPFHMRNIPGHKTDAADSEWIAEAVFRRRARKGGTKKATIATAHQILVIAYCILRDGSVYIEKGGDFFDKLNPARALKRITQRAAKLGYAVKLEALGIPLEPPVGKRPRGRPRKAQAALSNGFIGP